MCRADIYVRHDAKLTKICPKNSKHMTVGELKNEMKDSNSIPGLKLFLNGIPLDNDSAPLCIYSNKPRFEIQVVQQVTGG